MNPILPSTPVRMQQPSVLAPAPIDLMTPARMEGFESFPAEPSSPNRRQRISMACQYCRHRKIRCCGGAPCRNCTRSHRECEYAPVPEEVNRATREKKAIAKATKGSLTPAGTSSSTFALPTPVSTYSPFMSEAPTFEAPYFPNLNTLAPPRPGFGAHRRSISTPNFDTFYPHPPTLSVQTHTPLMASPAMYESNAWMYGHTPTSADWSTVPSAPEIPTMLPSSTTQVYPSVLEQPIQSTYIPTSIPPTTPPDSRSGSAEVELAIPVVHPPLTTSYSTPNLNGSGYLRPPLSVITPSPPITPGVSYYSPYPSPRYPQYAMNHPMPQMSNMSMSWSPAVNGMVHPSHISPTLAPEMQKDHFIGLGIGGEMDVYQSPTIIGEEYLNTPHF